MYCSPTSISPSRHDLNLTIIGTYFFFSQSSIWLLRLLKSGGHFIYEEKRALDIRSCLSAEG
ncbi:hypothetical protein PO124_15695 [Bacillus licheniformis]|nr:hypothetical protein [Bacillus licheniformis]